MNSKNKTYLSIFIALFFILILGIWTIWQFQFNYMISMYDTFFHSQRIYEIRLAFQQHTLPNWLNFNSFFNTGQAINGMYPDFSLWPFVWVTNFLTPIHQIIAIRSLIALSTFLVSFLSINKRFNHLDAVLAATIFTLSGSVLKDLLNEMQTGSAIVMIFAFPILFNLKEIIESKKMNPQLIVKVALLMTVVINSHLLSAVSITLIAGIFLIINTVIHKNFFSWLNLYISALLTIVLCSPLIYRLLKISKTGLLAPFGKGHVTSESLWTLFSTTAWNGKSTISIMTLILLAIVIIGFKKQKLSALLPWIYIELALILFCTNIIPWNLLSHLPILDSFQVANWRFAPFLGMIPLILVLINFNKKQVHFILTTLTVLSYVMAVRGALNAQYQKTDNLPTISQYSTQELPLNSSAKVTSTGINSDKITRTLIPDYAPNTTPIEKNSNGGSLDYQTSRLLLNHLAITKKGLIPVTYNNTVHNLVMNISDVPSGNITLPVFGYKSLNYKITVNQRQTKAHLNKDGFIVINSHKDLKNATYVISQVQPQLYNALIFISFALFFVLLIFYSLPTFYKLKSIKK